MDFNNFQKIIMDNGYEYKYYHMIFDILTNDKATVSYEDRKELLCIIKEQNFYNYSYTSHLSGYDSNGFLDSFSSLNNFHNANKVLYN